MLLPAVNLVNLNTSRIMERASEIGVRKAFGASSRTLVGQFVVENLVLTLVGAARRVPRRRAAAPGHQRQRDDPVRAAAAELPHLRLGRRCWRVAFGLLSGVYPAWRMSRLHPVQALKGASR